MRTQWFTTAVGLLLGTMAAMPAAGQTDFGPLITDRPDQATSTAVVGRGALQIETGLLFTQDDEGGTRARSLTVPNVLARFGLAPSLEGRIGFAGWIRNETRANAVTSSASGLGDVDIGAKYALHEGTNGRPSVAIIGTIKLPTGATGFGGERADPTLIVAAARPLSDRVGVTANLGGTASTVPIPTGSRTLTSILYTLSFGFAVADGVGAFAETFGTVALDDGVSATRSIDAGLTFLLSPTVQLDVAGGFGVNGAAADWFLGTGISVRVPR